MTSLCALRIDKGYFIGPNFVILMTKSFSKLIRPFAVPKLLSLFAPSTASPTYL